MISPKKLYIRQTVQRPTSQEKKTLEKMVNYWATLESDTEETDDTNDDSM